MAVLYLALLNGAGAAPTAGAPAGAPARAPQAAPGPGATAVAPRDDGAGWQVSSGDGLLVLQAQAEPPCLLVFDGRPGAHGAPLHAIVPAARDGRVATHIAALRTAPLRRSFIVAPADLPELWEISYDPHAEDLYDGLVHDYRFGEGVPRRGFLGLRRILLPEPLAVFVLDPHEAEAWGLAAAPPAGSGEGQVINLDVRRRVAVMPAAEMREAMASRHRPEASGPRVLDAASAPQAPAPSAQATQRRTASRPWPCRPPNVRAP